MEYCDLVMKGGITSGVVYPNAVLALAKQFRFKNIGGTSAGAIAAAASAAAACGDRLKQSKNPPASAIANEVGFEGLAFVAADLASQGFIYKLFQPALGARNAYRLIVTLAGNSGIPKKIFAVLASVFLIAPVEVLAVFVFFLALGSHFAGFRGMEGAAFPGLLCAYAAGVAAAVLRTARVARRNLMGLCNGLSARGPFGKRSPALTEWLHGVLQRLSGKPDDEPLTFRDLWDAERYPQEPETPRALSLQMITTCVSHHEPRTLPFFDGAFWFREEDFGKLFPSSIVDWLVQRAGEPIRTGGYAYYRLPEGPDLPVLVGTRMSLSFPLLISAVPLYEPASWSTSHATAGIDPLQVGEEDEGQGVGERTLAQSTDRLSAGGRSSSRAVESFRVCWFSDGGISSNFPLHLFDAPLPVWPTFAIDLVYADTDDSSDRRTEPWLPSGNNQGWQSLYQKIQSPLAIAEIGSFLSGIVGTMQNWRDLLLARAPGQRDRIVHVPLSRDQGGMNLNMSGLTLKSIADKGTKAGQEFGKFSFPAHYWIRWRNLASAVQRFTIAVADSVECAPPVPEFESAYKMARAGIPQPTAYKFKTKSRERAAMELYGCLAQTGKEWRGRQRTNLTVGAPRPLPQLQITPIF